MQTKCTCAQQGKLHSLIDKLALSLRWADHLLYYTQILYSHSHLYLEYNHGLHSEQ